MSDKFLGYGGGSDISDGTALVYAASLGASNLDPSMPLKTNSTRQLVTTKLDIADVNNLQTSLNNTISNPFGGELTAQSYVATQGNPNKRIRVTEDTITSDNRTTMDFSTADTIDLQATNVLVNGIALPFAAEVTALEQKTQYLTAAGGVTVFDSPLNMNSSKITGMADPTQPQDAATMAYVNKEVAAVVHPDQSLNTTDDVTFNSVTTSNINANGVETLKLNANQIWVNAPIIFRGVVAPDVAGGRDIGVAPGPFRTVYCNTVNATKMTTGAAQGILTLYGNTEEKDYVRIEKDKILLRTSFLNIEAVGGTETTGTIFPSAPETYDLGKTTRPYNNIYSKAINTTNLTTTGAVVLSAGSLQITGTTVQIQNSGTCQIQPTGALTLKAFNCTGDITLNGNSTVTGLKTPFLNSDAVPRSYADGLIGKHAIYAVSSLPAASGRAATVVYVNDESGGATMAFSDGINWRRVQDRAIVK